MQTDGSVALLFKDRQPVSAQQCRWSVVIVQAGVERLMQVAAVGRPGSKPAGVREEPGT